MDGMKVGDFYKGAIVTQVWPDKVYTLPPDVYAERRRNNEPTCPAEYEAQLTADLKAIRCSRNC